jgi:hypothetical protein
MSTRRAARGGLLHRLEKPAQGTFVAPALIAVERHRRSGPRGLRPGAACRDLPGAEDLDRVIADDQRHRLRADLRAAHTGSTTGCSRSRKRSRGQHLRQPQPDRRHRRQPAVRRRGAVGHRAEGGRAALSRPFHARRKRAPANRKRGHRGADPMAVQSRLDQLKPARFAALSTQAMPGVTGESNRLSAFARGRCPVPRPRSGGREGTGEARRGTRMRAADRRAGGIRRRCDSVLPRTRGIWRR